MVTAQEIRDQGLALGLSSVGIIRPEAMAGYADRVLERLAKTPRAALLNKFLGYSRARETWPWAKAIVVATLDLTRYSLPTGPARHFGKHYLFDSRRNPASPEAARIAAFTASLLGLGLKVAYDEHPGVTAMRWAAMSAGLGRVRHNNFLYGPNGSFLAIAAWIIDQELELVEAAPQRPCPQKCRRCVEACPTGALSAPFTMDLTRCVSLLTTANNLQAYDARTRKEIGLWLYGCDACQDACPHNEKAWDHGHEDFPGLLELVPSLEPGRILQMGLGEIASVLSPKFFYIKDGFLERWKLNAQNVLDNLVHSRY